MQIQTRCNQIREVESSFSVGITDFFILQIIFSNSLTPLNKIKAKNLIINTIFKIKKALF